MAVRGSTRPSSPGRVKFGVEHDVLVGWDYQLYDNYTDRRGAANFNTTPMDLYNPVETHVPVDVIEFPGHPDRLLHAAHTRRVRPGRAWR